MTKKSKIIIIIAVAGVIVLFAGIGIARAMARTKTSGIPKNAPSVQVEAAKIETIITKVNASGKVELVDDAKVFAATSAKVSKVFVKVGDVVKQGDTLLTYDPETLDALKTNLADAELSVSLAELNLKSAKAPSSATELLQAETQVKTAEKTVSDVNAQIEQADINYAQLLRNLNTAEENYRKTKVLFDQGIQSKSELDNAENAVTSLNDQIKTAESQKSTLVNSLVTAQSSLELMKKQYQTALNKTSDSTVKNNIEQQQIALEQAISRVNTIKKDIADFKEQEIAPVSGTVLLINATDGQLMGEGTQIAQIADISVKNMVIVDYVPENDTRNLALNQEVEISGGALGKTAIYKGHVSKIFPVAEMRQLGSSTSPESAITVEITPDTQDIPIKVGYSVDTDIITKVSEDVVVVPLMSLVSESGGVNYVYVVNDQNTVEKRFVELLTYSNLYVEATNVAAGEKVIKNPTANSAVKITEGIIVKASDY